MERPRLLQQAWRLGQGSVEALVTSNLQRIAAWTPQAIEPLLAASPARLFSGRPASSDAAQQVGGGGKHCRAPASGCRRRRRCHHCVRHAAASQLPRLHSPAQQPQEHASAAATARSSERRRQAPQDRRGEGCSWKPRNMLYIPPAWEQSVRHAMQRSPGAAGLLLCPGPAGLCCHCRAASAAPLPLPCAAAAASPCMLCCRRASGTWITRSCSSCGRRRR